MVKTSAKRAAKATTKKQRARSVASTGPSWLEQVVAEGQGQRKRGRQASGDAMAAAKIVNDHFRGLTDQEKYVSKVGGKELGAQLTEGRLLWLVGEIAVGKSYYAELRRRFVAEDTPFHRVNVEDKAQPSDDELCEAL